MKKQLLIASVLLLTTVAFGQKKELRDISKQIRKGELAQAKSALKQIKNTATSNADFASEYYFLEGKVNVEMAKKGSNILASLQEATNAFAKVKELDGNKSKYSSEIQTLTSEATTIATKQAQSAYERKDYKTAATAFEQVYRLSPKDTVFLYNSAVLSIQAKNYDKALKNYLELKKLGYDGTEITYIARNKQTKEEESFANKNQRDLMIKSGTYDKPRTEKSASKRGEIFKNIAIIYIEQGKTDEALAAFKDARKIFPKDATIIMNEASIYLQLDDKDKFKELMQEAAELDPKNADLQYNIGVINLQQNNFEEARVALYKALELRPNYSEAAMNISTIYINEGNALVEKMNALGNSKADIKKHDQLRTERDNLFRKAAEVLEDYTKKQGNNNSILDQLKNIYGALGDTANFKRIKALLGE